MRKLLTGFVFTSLSFAAQAQGSKNWREDMAPLSAYLTASKCAPCGIGVSYTDSTYSVSMTIQADYETLKEDSVKANSQERLKDLRRIGAGLYDKKFRGARLMYWTGERHGFINFTEEPINNKLP